MENPRADPPTIQLVHDAAAGDRRAGQLLVQGLRPIVHAAVARMVLRVRGSRGVRLRQEIEDLVQDVLVALLADKCRKLRAWDASRGRQLHTFVAFLAQREVISILRRREPEETTLDGADIREIGDPGVGPEQSAISRDLLVKIYQRAQTDLTTTLAKAMFGWLIIDGLSVDEVCELGAMNHAAVYAWRKRIADVLQRAAADILSNRGSK